MKNKNGITLIALIITIIVLLILAGISISMVIGDNGILNKAVSSKKKTIIGTEKEDLTLLYNDYIIQYPEGKITFEEYLNNIEYFDGNHIKDGNTIKYNYNNEIIDIATFGEYIEVEEICVGYYNNVAIDKNGDYWVWGRNEYGQLGIDFPYYKTSIPQKIDIGVKIVEIQYGYYNGVILDENGDVWISGTNMYGMLGNPSIENATKFEKMNMPEKVEKIYVGSVSLCMETESGNFYAVGYNAYNQFDSNITGNLTIPQKIEFDIEIKDMIIGEGATIILDINGNIYSIGDNTNGQLGDGTTTQRETLEKIECEATFTEIEGGASHVLALDVNGNIWSWGYNYYGQVGIGTTDKSILTPTQITATSDFVDIGAGYYSSKARKSDGSIYVWGGNFGDSFGFGNTENVLIPTILTENSTDIKMFEIGKEHSLRLMNDGALYAYGNNNHSQRGNGKEVTLYGYTKINTDIQFTDIKIDVYSVLGLDTNGKIWTWGRNANGEVGNGTQKPQYEAINILPDLTFSQICTGPLNSCIVLDTNGDLWRFGRESYKNDSGNTSYQNISIPHKIEFDKKVKQIACSNRNVYIIDEDSNLYGMGENKYSRITSGTDYQTDFVQMMAGVKFKKVDTSSATVIAIDEDGNFYAGGSNSAGIFGDGTKNNSEFKKIELDFKIKDISVYMTTVLAIDENNELYIWGNTLYGENSVISTVPIKLAEGTKFKYIETGTYNYIAIDMDGNIWGAGYNDNYQLGEPRLDYRVSLEFSKIQDGNFSKVGINGGYIYGIGASLAIDENGTLYGTGSNNDRQLLLEEDTIYDRVHIIEKDGFKVY